MDIARQIEQNLKSRLKPIHDVMDRGDSPVQQFYRGATVLVTGGSGFLGKQLIEKLFRSCEINKVYVLMRSKKSKPIKERLNLMLNDPVYDLLRERKPKFEEKIFPIVGDVSEIKLGVSDKDWITLTEEVTMIFHLAATVKFDAPLKDATLTNVRGTREVLTLAKGCKSLHCLVYVSTAFTHATTSRVGSELKEQFYPSPVAPDAIIHLAEDFQEQRLVNMTPEMIRGWPNTYTFTKAVAEELVKLNAGDLPICVVKPPVVPPAYIEPSPGWGDTSVVYGPAGILIGVGLGVLHTFYTKTNLLLNFVPVDYINNGILVAAWDSTNKRAGGVKEIPIYTISSTKCGIVWDFMGNTIRSDSFKRLCSPLAVWYCYLVETDNKFIYWLIYWVLHYIPAYILDLICKVMKIKFDGIESFMKIYTKIYKMSLVFGHFLCNEWKFSDENTTKMIANMSDSDRVIYNCDVHTIDYGEYLRAISVGLRKYVVKDGLKDSDKAYRRQKWLYYANIVFLSLYAYVLYLIVCYFIWFVKIILGF